MQTVITTADALVLVHDYPAGGTLVGLLAERGRLSAGEVVTLGTSVAGALEAVRAVLAQDLGLPVVGAGGVYSVEAAREMLGAGAAAVQLDAVVWTRPQIVEEMRAVVVDQ